MKQRPKSDIDTHMQASDPDKGRGTGFARGHFAIERLREIIIRVVVPPVAPVA